MESIIKTIIANPEKISLVLVLFLFGGVMVWLVVKMQKSRDELHVSHAKNLMSINEKTIGGFDKMSGAITKFAESQTDLATEIKILRSK